MADRAHRGRPHNLLYRAIGPRDDLTCKSTIHDQRDRAGHEYGALSALRQAGLQLAPEPLLLDRSSYAQPVVVQTWLQGEVSAAPPATMADWQSLLQHQALVHTVTPDNTGVMLPYAAVVARDAEEGRERVRQQVGLLPDPGGLVGRPAGMLSVRTAPGAGPAAVDLVTRLAGRHKGEV